MTDVLASATTHYQVRGIRMLNAMHTGNL